ncbi:MAG: DinB family protein [Candidatus Sifarchaeia archaeon]
MKTGSETKEELISQLHTDRRQLEELLSTLTPEEVEIEGAQGDRSVKDIVAHITAWERYGIGWIQSLAKGQKPEMPVPETSMDAVRQNMAIMNAEIHKKNENQPLQDILEEFRHSYKMLVKEIEALPAERLDETFNYEWSEEPVSGRHLIAWRYWHYRAHLKHIQEWILQR